MELRLLFANDCPFFTIPYPNRKTQKSNPVGTLAAEIEIICGLFAVFCGHAKED
jgi:hypothetical protein